MDKLKYEIVTLKNGNQYFVLDTVFFEYDIYNLVLNLEDENDVNILLQEIKNGKTVLTEVTDKLILSKVAPLFEESLRNKILNNN